MTSGATGAVVLLVDDHRVFADVLGEVLLAEPGISRINRAASLKAARVMLAADPPDLVLLDLMLADESGFDLLGDLTRTADAPPAIVLSGSSEPRLIVKALELGANGWLSKTTALDALLTAVWQVLDGQLYLAPTTLRPVLNHLLSDRQERQTATGFIDCLTPRELDVLRCLVSGMTRAEVAAHLFVSTNTVRTHVQSLLRRSDQHSALALVAFARSHGVRGADEIDDLQAAAGPRSPF